MSQAACLAKSGRLEDSKMLIGQVAQSCAEHHGPPLLLLLLLLLLLHLCHGFFGVAPAALHHNVVV